MEPSVACHSSSRVRPFLLALVSCLCLAFAGYVVYGLVWVPHFATPPIGGAFALTDHTGKLVTDRDFTGRYRLVYFGYTSCPDVCPTELLKLSQAMDLVLEAAPEAKDRLAGIFITVDPERDTVAVLRDFVPHFHPLLVGLTGEAVAIREAASAFHVSFNKVAERSADDYLMDHVSYIFLMDPEGHYLSHFTVKTQMEQMATEIARNMGLETVF